VITYSLEMQMKKN